MGSKGAARLFGFNCAAAFAGILYLCAAAVVGAPAASAAVPPAACVLVEVEGKVEMERKGSTAWTAVSSGTELQTGDRLRTGSRSRATVRWSELSVVRVAELTTLEIRPPASPAAKPQLELRSGATYFFSRERPADIGFHTPVASGAIRGTEFNLAVSEDGRTEVALLDGRIELTNAQGAVALNTGEEGKVEPGHAPAKTALINAINVIQWVLYYPAVLDPDELGLGSQARETLHSALDSYRNGALPAALQALPPNWSPSSDAERLFQDGLLLAVGQAEQVEADLKNLQSPSPLGQALRELIAAVKHQTLPGLPPPDTASGWLARSYYVQSQGKLTEALEAARQATTKSPHFGAAWVRVADLEFSFGHTDGALSALDRGLALSPQNAEGLALKGFLLAARNEFAAAEAQFDQAMAVDGALANAWLGRGLVKIRRGMDRNLVDIGSVAVAAGRADLQVAATLEPQRAILRSYLGKAFLQAHDLAHARKELDLARQLDPNDPTSWLYTALLDQQDNRVNEAVTDLERSKALNDNRTLFRSRLLLDQDQAVRSANLAAIYRDDGMFDRSVQEAAQAVDDDYGNYSAHLFLANSYDALRDPKLINLRYETPWFNELLLADLLAPAAAGSLSQNVSQQEYSKLFAADGLGLYSRTEYWSRGNWWQSASQYGNFGNTSYSFDSFYHNDNGFRPNNDLEQLELDLRLKQQLTAKDSLFFQVGYFNSDSGDVAQYYDQTNASKTLRAQENQQPSLLAGYHREWAPGSHTLFLFSRIDDTLQLQDSNPALLALLTRDFPPPTVSFVQNPSFYSINFKRDLTAYSAEAQQIWEKNPFTFIAGGRYQNAPAETSDFLQRTPPAGQITQISLNNHTDLERLSFYGYAEWLLLDSLRLIGGVTYDHLHYPVNIDTSPISDAEESQDRVSPKAAIVWTPAPDTRLRAIYSRSLGGSFFDTSVRLEPTELAGFNDAFRSLIPESVAGLVPGTRFETWGAGWDQKFWAGTYLTVQGEYLKSDATRTVGILTNSDTTVIIPDSPSSTPQQLDYKEKSLVVALNQLLPAGFAVGARYKLTDAALNSSFPEISPNLFGASSLYQNVEATLNQLDLSAIYQARCGFFAQFDALYSQQSNRHYTPDIPGDNFWQYNVYAGYRFWQRRAEARLGLLNLSNRDYRLNPLTLYNELPRTRILSASLKLNF